MTVAITPLRVAVLLLAGISMLIGSTFAQSGSAPLALEGYSPVSYFTEGRPEKGKSAYAVVYKGHTYYFTDAGQQAMFEADPEAYAPVFPVHCPYNLALGRKAKIDPTNFKIVGGRLLLFHRTEEMDGRKRWNEHGDEQELMQRARGQWLLLRNREDELGRDRFK